MLWPDVTELKNFYDSPLGQVCTHSLRKAVANIWPEAKNETLIGIGYPLPTLRPFLKSADVVGAVMPSGQGVIHWPKGQDSSHTILSHESLLPFHSGTLNRIIMLHVIEHAQPISQLFEEAERCLTPSGRMLILVPNRASFWARAEHTPYAHGQPYSLIQLKNLLTKQGFSIIQSQQALFFPPTNSRAILKFAPFIEKLVSRFFPHFGGMLLLEIEKRKEAPVKGTPVKVFAKAVNPATSLNRDSV